MVSTCRAYNNVSCQQEHRRRIADRCPTEADLRQEPQLWRDSHLSKDDLHNMRRQQQQQLWRLHDVSAVSIDLWQQAHPELVFSYQQQRQAADQIFVLGLQSEQQQQWLLQYGRVLFMDSTFGTNHCRVR